MESGTSSSTDGYVVTVDIGPVDLFNLKSTQGIGTSVNSSYLTMTGSAIDDSEGVDAIAVTDGKGIKAANFAEDMAPPEFVGFSLDMNAATLALTFSESMNLSSLLVNNLTLYSDESY